MSKLWFDRPAENWTQAQPIGNGRLGAMIYGRPTKEHFQLNEDSIWYGGSLDRENPDARESLGQIRLLLSKGDPAAAEKLISYTFTGTPLNQRVYQPLGDLFLNDFSFPADAVQNYRRELCLASAVHEVSFCADGRSYRRTSFASAPDGCIVLRMSAGVPGSVSFDARLRRGVFYNRSCGVSGDTVALYGDTGSGGVSFCMMAKLIPSGGTCRVLGDHLTLENADSALLLLTAHSTYRTPDPEQECLKTLAAAAAFSFEELLSRHMSDYAPLFDRCRLTLPKDDAADLIPTDRRLERNRETPDNGLMEQYFDFGRYLMLSGSRPGTLPLNLQGIWNENMAPPWDSKYTININTEMNYWPAETCAMQECHLALIEHIRRMWVRGRKTAADMYGCRGFVAHHNTDLWADCAPEGDYIPGSYWVAGGAWLTLHMWEHYLFSPDAEYLRSIYPVMRDAALFFIDFLVPLEEYLTVSPTVSPENSYFAKNGDRVSICAGAAMDYQILRDLFRACEQAGELLGEDPDFCGLLRQTREKLPPDRVGKHGQIMEWIEDYDEAEPGHRHISHLFSVYPSHQISPDKTPELAAAAKRTLARRLENGGGHTGWSLAWIINLYARLWNAEEAYRNLHRLLTDSTQPNLMDTHPPFQIDGNLGGTAGIAEMLVQSDSGRILLLPALPKEWAAGKITGVRLRGGARADIFWEDGVLREAVIYPAHPLSRTAVYQGKSILLKLEPGTPIRLTPDLFS